MKIEIITKAAFREGATIEVNGVPYVIDHVDHIHGLRLSAEVPGLRNEDGTPLKVDEVVPWSDILQARVI